MKLWSGAASHFCSQFPTNPLCIKNVSRTKLCYFTHLEDSQLSLYARVSPEWCMYHSSKYVVSSNNTSKSSIYICSSLTRIVQLSKRIVVKPNQLGVKCGKTSAAIHRTKVSKQVCFSSKLISCCGSWASGCKLLSRQLACQLRTGQPYSSPPAARTPCQSRSFLAGLPLNFTWQRLFRAPPVCVAVWASAEQGAALLPLPGRSASKQSLQPAPHLWLHLWHAGTTSLAPSLRCVWAGDGLRRPAPAAHTWPPQSAPERPSAGVSALIYISPTLVFIYKQRRLCSASSL